MLRWSPEEMDIKLKKTFDLTFQTTLVLSRASTLIKGTIWKFQAQLLLIVCLFREIRK